MPETLLRSGTPRWGRIAFAQNSKRARSFIASVIILGRGLESVKARAVNRWALAFRHQRGLPRSFKKIRELTTVQGADIEMAMTGVTCS